jgi:hypothetical protein
MAGLQNWKKRKKKKKEKTGMELGGWGTSIHHFLWLNWFWVRIPKYQVI